MTWLLSKPVLYAIGAGLLAIAGWYAYGKAVDRGYRLATAEWEAKYERDMADALAIALETERQAAEQVARIRRESDEALAKAAQGDRERAQRIRTVRVEVPADCPVRLPDSLRDEIAAAASEANAAR